MRRLSLERDRAGLLGMATDLGGVEVAQHCEIARLVASHLREACDTDFAAGIVDIGQCDRQVELQREVIEALAQMIRRACVCPRATARARTRARRPSAAASWSTVPLGVVTIDRSAAPKPHQASQVAPGKPRERDSLPTQRIGRSSVRLREQPQDESELEVVRDTIAMPLVPGSPSNRTCQPKSATPRARCGKPRRHPGGPGGVRAHPDEVECFPVPPKPPAPRSRGAEVFDDVEVRLHDRNDDKLGQPLERIQRERRAAIPGGDHQLVIGVDQTDQVAEHDTVFVAQAGPRQDQRSVARRRESRARSRRDGWPRARAPAVHQDRRADRVPQPLVWHTGQTGAQARIEDPDIDVHAFGRFVPNPWATCSRPRRCDGVPRRGCSRRVSRSPCR